MRSPRAILFDAVGTVITPTPTVDDVYHRLGQQHGSLLSRAEVSTRLRHAMAARWPDDLRSNDQLEHARWRTVVEQVFHDVIPIDLLFTALWQHFAQGDSWRLYPDVEPVWRELTAKGYLLGIASNFDERLPLVCRDLPPLDTCQRVFYSAQLGHAKPHASFFQQVQLRLRLRADQILLVGNDLVCDLTGAKNAGWQAVLVDRDDQHSSVDRIDSLADLPPMLASWKA